MSTSIKTSYFIDYWLDVSNTNNSIENELIHPIVYNPRDLLNEFIEEIDRNNLSNKDNKRFFIDKFNTFSNLDIKSLESLKPTIKLIRQQFSKKEPFDYLKHLLQMLINQISDFSIARNVITELENTLTNDKGLETNKIKTLVNLLVTELVHKGYSNKTITDIISNIFSNYYFTGSENEGKRLLTNFPHNFKNVNPDINSKEYKEYCRQVTQYIDSLTLSDRVLALNYYLDKESEKLFFIFQVKGLKGENADFNLGDVHFYNPSRITRIKNSFDKSVDETFKSEKDITYCNAAVEVIGVDFEQDKNLAIQKLEEALDAISSRYSSYKIPLQINAATCYVIDSDGNQQGAVFSNHLELLDYQDSLNLKNEDFNKLTAYLSANFSNSNLKTIDKKISESMHWNRKAIETLEPNEKLLWHWVALENIFENKNQNTTISILDTVPKLLAKRQLYNFAWMHFKKLETCLNNGVFNSTVQQKIEIPSSLKKKIGMDTVGTIYLKDFIDHIETIKIHLTKDTLLYEQLTNLSKIFEDKNLCLNLLKDFEKNAYEKLVYIYRARNKIVHNANTKQTSELNSHVIFASIVASLAINNFLEIRTDLELSTSHEIICNINYEYEKFQLLLESEGTTILLDRPAS